MYSLKRTLGFLLLVLVEYNPNISVSGHKIERIKYCELLGDHISAFLRWTITSSTQYLDVTLLYRY